MLKRTALTGLQIVTILAVIALMLTSAARAAVPQPDLGALKLSDRATAQDAGFVKVGYFKKGHGHHRYKKRGFGHRKFGHRKFGHKKFGYRKYGHRKFGHRSYGHRSYGHRSSSHYEFGHKKFGQKRYGSKHNLTKYSAHAGIGARKLSSSKLYVGSSRFRPETRRKNAVQVKVLKRHHQIAENSSTPKVQNDGTFNYGASTYPDQAPKNHGHDFKNTNRRLKDVPKGITRPRPSTQKFDYGNSSFKPSAPKNHGHDFRN